MDYNHTRKICKGFVIKKLGGYHDLYLKSDTLILANVFKNLRNMCLEIYELDPERFLVAPRLA